MVWLKLEPKHESTKYFPLEIVSLDMNLKFQKTRIPERKLIRKSPFSVLYYNFNDHLLLDTYPAKMPDQLANDMVLMYSEPGDIVLDPLCGSGTTLREAIREGRKAIGIDINKLAIDLCYQDPLILKAELQVADARHTGLEENSVNLIVTSPPYGTIIAGKKIAYSDNKEDLSNARDYDEFRAMLKDCLKEMLRVLKPGCMLAINVKSRNKVLLRPLPAYIMVDAIEIGFWPWAWAVLPTHPYMIWTFGDEKHRKFIPAHEDLLLFRKPDPKVKLKEEDDRLVVKVDGNGGNGSSLEEWLTDN